MASVVSTSERDELSKRLSRWAQREMGHEISPDAFLQLLHTPDMIENLTHVVSNLKSVSPLDSMHHKVEEIAQPASAEHTNYEKLCEDESAMSIEIAQLKKDLQVCVDLCAAQGEKIVKLESEVFMYPSKVHVLNAHRSLVEKFVQNAKSLTSQVETALSDLPCSTAGNSNNSLLAADLQEALETLSEYHETSRRRECAKKFKEILHKKLREMAKSYKSEDYFDFFESQKEIHDLKLEMDISYTQVTKKIMKSCFFDLQSAQEESFAMIQALYNKIRDLQYEKAGLMKELSHAVSADNHDWCRTKLEIIRKEELLKHLSERQIPEGMLSPNYKDDLMSVQHQIEDQEESLKTLNIQLAQMCYANNKLLDKFQTTFMDESRRPGNLSKDLQAGFNLEHFHVKQDAVENWLEHINTSQPQLSNLCVRPNSQIIPSRIKVELQSALNMPFYEAPEMISLRLLKLMEDYGDNRNIAQILSLLIGSLDLESCKQSLDEIFRSVEGSHSRAEHVITKADQLAQCISLLIKCEGLQQCLNDLQKEPAFNKNVL